MSKEFTRREAMKTAMQGAAYVAPVVLAAAIPAGVAAATPPPSPFQVSLFASGTGARTKPDSITSDGQNIYVGYQNTTAADGSDGGPSTIVMYTSAGQEVRSFNVQGRCDGLRFNPVTQLLWATVNEDGNSSLFTIDPNTGTTTHYTFSAAPHGGGYDDLAFVNGMAFVAASNPTNLTTGVNTNPAVAKVVLNGTTATLTPVLLGNATVTDVKTNQPVALNLLDPDSMSLDLAGNVVLVSQADSQIIIIQNAGSPNQSASVLSANMQLDDTAWATTTTGRLFVVDAKQNTISVIRDTSGFTVGTVYTEVAPDTGTGLVGTVDLKTGVVTQIVNGFTKPTGLIFVP
ncbi:MAG: hypothetical protein ACYDAR_04045 [Thermomicrobiales bacterium]